VKKNPQLRHLRRTLKKDNRNTYQETDYYCKSLNYIVHSFLQMQFEGNFDDIKFRFTE
jgi:hypothetical protein